jgi:flagellar motor protein MotB
MLASRRRRSPDEDNPYWISFSDVMSALLIIFILASLVLILELTETRSSISEAILDLERADQVRRTVLEEAQAELEERGIRVEIGENHSVLRIPNELLGFETSQYVLEERYMETARQIGEVVSEVLRRGSRTDYIDTIFLEGHTDSRPFAGLMGMGNWGLSTFRAISLWDFWRKEFVDERDLTRLTNRDGEPLFSVSGYGPSRPITATQYTENEYRANRRIDLRITIRRPEIREYEHVRDLLGRSP